MGNILQHFTFFFNQIMSCIEKESPHEPIISLIFCDCQVKEVLYRHVQKYFSPVPWYRKLWISGYTSKFPGIIRSSPNQFHIDAKSDNFDTLHDYFQGVKPSTLAHKISSLCPEERYHFKNLLKQFNLALDGNVINRQSQVDDQVGTGHAQMVQQSTPNIVLRFRFNDNTTRIVRNHHVGKYFTKHPHANSFTPNQRYIIPLGRTGKEFFIDAKSDNFDILMEYFRFEYVPDFMLERIPVNRTERHHFENLLKQFNLELRTKIKIDIEERKDMISTSEIPKQFNLELRTKIKIVKEERKDMISSSETPTNDDDQKNDGVLKFIFDDQRCRLVRSQHVKELFHFDKSQSGTPYRPKSPGIIPVSSDEFFIDAKSDNFYILLEYLKSGPQKTVPEFMWEELYDCSEEKYHFLHLLKQFNLTLGDSGIVEMGQSEKVPLGASDPVVVTLEFSDRVRRDVRYQQFKDLVKTREDLPDDLLKLDAKSTHGRRFHIDAKSEHFDIVLDYFRSGRVLQQLWLDKISHFTEGERSSFDHLVKEFNLYFDENNLNTGRSKSIVLIDRSALLDEDFKERLQSFCSNKNVKARIEMSEGVKSGELCLIVNRLREDDWIAQENIYKNYSRITSMLLHFCFKASIIYLTLVAVIV